MTLKFALEAKPNEPRGDLYLPTTGAMIGFITTLDHPEMVGVNPEVARRAHGRAKFYACHCSGLGRGQTLHIDLNDQKFGRYDQDFRFGAK